MNDLNLNLKMNINDIDFIIKDITSTRKGNVNYNYFEYRMSAITNFKNYQKVIKWQEMISFASTGVYKIDFNNKYFSIKGIFPIDIKNNFDNTVEVFFSIDCFNNTNLELYRKQELRKQKLLAIQSKVQ